jgi:hypothetical protein
MAFASTAATLRNWAKTSLSDNAAAVAIPREPLPDTLLGRRHNELTPCRMFFSARFTYAIARWRNPSSNKASHFLVREA